MSDPFLASPQTDASSSKGPESDWMSPPKIVLIAGLALATLVPSYFVAGLIAERETRQDTVQSEFTRNWGPQQNLYTPTLVVPYQSAPDCCREYLKIAPVNGSRSLQIWSHKSAGAACFMRRSTMPRSRCRAPL